MKNNLSNFLNLIVLLSLLFILGFENPQQKQSSISIESPEPKLNWSVWRKTPKPIFTGQYPLVGDASVIKEADGSYRMTYTCFDAFRKIQGPEICGALSRDGLKWDFAPVGKKTLKGRLLETGPKIWDTAHETSFLLKFNGKYYLYFIGYVDKGGVYNSIPSSIGFASSSDGLHFTRAAEPILTGTPKGYDSEVISSPSIVQTEPGNYLMIYAGFCYHNCSNTPGIYLVGATSTDGKDWTKLPQPIINSSDIPWPNEGLAEAEMIKGPDGFYYLFITVLQGKNPHQIGVARSRSFQGPWQVNPKPIITAGTEGAFDEAEVVAPSILIENDKVRMWFHGVNKKKNAIAIGYAETNWPLAE